MTHCVMTCITDLVLFINKPFVSHIIYFDIQHFYTYTGFMVLPTRNHNLGADGIHAFDNNEVVVVRYLTPYKVAIVILSLLYLGDAIPSKHKPRIMGYIIDFLDTKTQVILDEGNLVTLKDVIDSMYEDNEIFENLLDILFCMCSIDELQTLMTRLPNFVLKADGKHNEEDEKVMEETALLGIKPVKQSSILGAFFTRCFLSFDCLAFDKVISLFDCLDYFRAPFFAHYQARRLKKRVSTFPMSLDVFFGPNFIPTDPRSLPLLQRPNPTYCISSESLESKMVGLSKNNMLSLNEMNNILKFLTENDKPLPVFAHFIKYYCALQERDYEQSFEHLHRYYDYTMHHHGRAQYHNALFTLANLHAEFESFDEAMRAVSEAISVARENKDTPALTDIHFWLYNFITLHPECKLPDSIPSKEQLLQFLKVKSQSTSYTLYSLALQQDALYQLSHCGSTTKALESLFKSSFISVISNSIPSAVGFCLAESVMWERVGISALSHLYNEISLDLSKKDMSKWLLVQYAIQRANILFENGKLADAFKLMESMKPAASESQVSYRRWYWNYMLLKLRHRINECKLDEAEFILQNLEPLTKLDFRSRMMYNIYQVVLKAKFGMWDAAKSTAWDLVESINSEDTDIWYHVLLMKTYVDLIIETEGRTSKALPIVLRLIGLAEKASISVFKYYGIIYLAMISADEDQINDSVSLLDAIMPRILETEAADLIAFAYKTLSDIMLKVALQTHDGINIKRFVEKSLGYLSKAGMYYEALQNWEKVHEVFVNMTKGIEFIGSVVKKGLIKQSQRDAHMTSGDEKMDSSENIRGDISLLIDNKTHNSHTLFTSSKETIIRLKDLIRQNKKSTSLGADIVFENSNLKDRSSP